MGFDARGIQMTTDAEWFQAQHKRLREINAEAARLNRKVVVYSRWAMAFSFISIVASILIIMESLK